MDFEGLTIPVMTMYNKSTMKYNSKCKNMKYFNLITLFNKNPLFLSLPAGKEHFAAGDIF